MANFYEVWRDGQQSKTIVVATNIIEALDTFCQHEGFIDHIDYCQEKNIFESDLNVVFVSKYEYHPEKGD